MSEYKVETKCENCLNYQQQILILQSDINQLKNEMEMHLQKQE